MLCKDKSNNNVKIIKRTLLARLQAFEKDLGAGQPFLHVHFTFLSWLPALWGHRRTLF